MGKEKEEKQDKLFEGASCECTMKLRRQLRDELDADEVELVQEADFPQGQFFCDVKFKKKEVKRWNKTFVVFNYCPICGKSYDEE